jgi:hypothetical protein
MTRTRLGPGPDPALLALTRTSSPADPPHTDPQAPRPLAHTRSFSHKLAMTPRRLALALQQGSDRPARPPLHAAPPCLSSTGCLLCCPALAPQAVPARARTSQAGSTRTQTGSTRAGLHGCSHARMLRPTHSHYRLRTPQPRPRLLD